MEVLSIAKRLKLSNPREIRRTLNRIANMVLNGQLDPKQANAIMYACNITLGAIRIDDQQAKLEEIEKALESLERSIKEETL